MAGQITMSAGYMLPRTILWIVLLGLTILDGLRHIYENARARKLYLAVVVVIGAMVAQDVLLTLYTIGGGNHFGAGILFQVYILVTDAADSLFTALLLAIAAGFCITREDFGPYKLKVTLIPTVYFVTIIIVDFIMYRVRGRSAFNVADFDSGADVDVALSSWERLLLVICAFVNLMALMAAWVYIFDTIQKEREALEVPEQDVYAEAEAGQAPAQVAEQQQGAAEGDGAGHAVRPPLEEEAPNAYGGVTGEDLDGPKTVEEKVARLAKIRLLKQFSFGVVAYVLATALVVLLPIFVSPQASAGETAVRVVLILQNLVLLLFMAGLAWIFRMRADSPYLVLDEEEGGAGEGDAHLRTELGVLGEDEEANGRGSPRSDASMDAFTLHDIEDDESPAQRPHAAAAQAAPPPAAVPDVDPKAEAPKAELLKGVPKSDEATQ